MHSLLGRVGQGPVSGAERALAPCPGFCAPVLTLCLTFCAPVLTLCLAFCAPALAGPGHFTLTVLHSNDTHSAYGGFDADGRLCYRSRCPGGQGGYGRLHQAIRALRRDRPQAILLDAGDFFQGSLYWSRHKAAMPTAVLRHFDYLALVPGNHEFDEGCGPCLDFLADVNAQPLAANLYFHSVEEARRMSFASLPEKEIAAQKRLKAYMIHEIDGRKIGIIGLVHPDTPHLSRPCRRAVFEAARSGLLWSVAELEAMGVDIIIALTHLGLEADRELAASVSGVDIIVGGHDHRLLSNSQEGADGPYPEIVLSSKGLPVLIVTAGANTRHLGRLEVAFDAAGLPLSWEGDALPLSDDSLRDLQAPAPDPDLEALLETFSAPIRDLFGESLGKIEAPGKSGLLESDIRDCRQGPCPTGNIVTQAMLAAVPEAGAALLNSGALRHSLPLGAVTDGDLLESFPFADHCVKSVMSGKVLLAALEHGLSGLEQGSGRFLQTAGLRYTFDATAAPGSRLREALIIGPDGVWRPVDKNGDYGVVTLKYLACGGDDFSFPVQLEWQDISTGLLDMLRFYLVRHSPLRLNLDDFRGRVQDAAGRQAMDATGRQATDTADRRTMDKSNSTDGDYN